MNVSKMLKENEQMIAEGQSGGPNAGKWISGMTGGAFGGGGQPNTGPSQGDALDHVENADAYRDMMTNGLRGSKPFTDAEIKRGYRKL